MPIKTPTLEVQVYLNLHRACERLAADFDGLFKAHGLTQPQYNVLRILRGAPDRRASCQYIAERLITRVPDVTRLLDRMVAANLVTRERSDEDRRVVLVSPTRKGHKICEQLERPVLELHRRQLRRLPRKTLSALNGALLELLGSPLP